MKRRRLSWHRRGVVLGLEEPPSDRAVVGPARRRRPDSTHVRRESNLVARGESPGVAPRPARRPDGKARRLRISGIFEGGATQPAGMHRRPNAAGLSPRAVRAHHGSTANSRTLSAKELIMDGVRMRPSTERMRRWRRSFVPARAHRRSDGRHLRASRQPVRVGCGLIDPVSIAATKVAVGDIAATTARSALTVCEVRGPMQ